MAGSKRTGSKHWVKVKPAGSETVGQKKKFAGRGVLKSDAPGGRVKIGGVKEFIN